METKFSDLLGKTIIEIKNTSDEIYFTCSDGVKYKMFHVQDCCESVQVEDIIGDLDDLLNSPILKAAADASDEHPVDKKPEYDESFTWTFYNIATIKGHVTIRWYGSSNGYYSEGVEFYNITDGEYY